MHPAVCSCSRSKSDRSGTSAAFRSGWAGWQDPLRASALLAIPREAGIAAEHCLAPSFQETRWDRVVECYPLLERIAPSALHRLKRAIATAEWQGPTAGLAVLKGFEPPTWLAGSYRWAAVLADWHRRCGHVDVAQQYRDTALQSAPTSAVKDLLKRRLGAIDGE